MFFHGLDERLLSIGLVGDIRWCSVNEGLKVVHVMKVVGFL
jgi:hypothetical protein